MAKKKTETQATPKDTTTAKETTTRRSRRTADAVKTVTDEDLARAAGRDASTDSSTVSDVVADEGAEHASMSETIDQTVVVSVPELLSDQTTIVNVPQSLIDATKSEEASKADAVVDSDDSDDEKTLLISLDEMKTLTEDSTYCPSRSKEQLLTRLRSGRLNAAQIYQEGQAFFSQALDIEGLLKSGEPTLVLNILEIFSRHAFWHAGAIDLMDASNADIAAGARQYVLEFVVQHAEVALAAADKLVAMGQKADEAVRAYQLCVLNAMTGRMSRAGDEALDWLPAFVRLLSCFDSSRVERMIYDSCRYVRIGVLRYLTSLSSVEINTLASCLILLKDSDEDINAAVLKLVGRFAAYPEIAVPILIDYAARGGLHQQLVLDAFHRFNDDAVAPMLAVLSEQSDAKTMAVKNIILASPQRYLEPLKEAYSSFRTRPQAKPRIADILMAISDGVDQVTRAQIIAFLQPPRAPEINIDDGSETRKIELIEPVFSLRDAFYSELLDDKALAKYKNVSTPELIRLLLDSRDVTRMNAINLARLVKRNDPDIRSTIGVWLKCYQEDVAKAAFDAYVELYHGERPMVLTQFIVDTIELCENRLMAAYYFDRIKADQGHVNNLIDIYRANPLKYRALVLRCLKDQPSKETIKKLGSCLTNDNDPSAVATTLQMLVKNSVDFDFEPYRKRLLEIIGETISHSEFARIMRLCSLTVLNKLTKDGDYDKATVEVLRSSYKRFYYPEYKKIAAEILKKMNEETFDDLEDEDGFEDLEEDD